MTLDVGYMTCAGDFNDPLVGNEKAAIADLLLPGVSLHKLLKGTDGLARSYISPLPAAKIEILGRYARKWCIDAINLIQYAPFADSE